MKWSETFIVTIKENPKEAEIKSHSLMLRAGLIQNLASGLYIYLPIGLKILCKIQNIIRKHLNRHGGIELSMPALQPKSIWEKSGRYEVLKDLMMKITDREDREFVLGPTHEEIITDLVSKRIQSFKELPRNFYQIQTKFRDEIRPRFGVMRAREFIMKDGYSFDMDESGLKISYQKMFEAYTAIFSEMGLKAYPVLADTGAMGDGGKSHEFMVMTPVGEDLIAYCDTSGYAANIELAPRIPQRPNIENESAELTLTKIHTPGKKSIEDVSAFLSKPADQMVKTFYYYKDDDVVMVLIRGDYDVNEIKLKRHLQCSQLNRLTEEQIFQTMNLPCGYLGPLGLKIQCPIIADTSLEGLKNMVAGSNEADYHYLNLNIGRDFVVDSFYDFGIVREGDLCPESRLPYKVSRGIEVGHIFMLGTKYSKTLGASVKDTAGNDTTLWMGCYGIGVSRLLATIIEEHCDDKGIVWPFSVAPYEVVIIPVDMKDESLVASASAIYTELQTQGVDVLFDDRAERMGFKIKDAELIGIPLRVIIGHKGLAKGMVELEHRNSSVKEEVSLQDLANRIKNFKPGL